MSPSSALPSWRLEFGGVAAGADGDAKSYGHYEDDETGP